MQYIVPEYDQYTQVTRESAPEDRWSGEDTCTSWNVHGLTLQEKDSYEALPCSFKVQPGVGYYLLYVVYSTGDSFSHSASGEIEFIGVYDNKEIAEKNRNRIEASNDGEYGNMKLLTNTGKEYKLYKPWSGYFENIEDINLVLMPIMVPCN